MFGRLGVTLGEKFPFKDCKVSKGQRANDLI